MHLCETGGLRGLSRQGAKGRPRGCMPVLTVPGTRPSPWDKALRVFSRLVKRWGIWGIYGLRKTLWLVIRPINDTIFGQKENA